MTYGLHSIITGITLKNSIAFRPAIVNFAKPV